MTKPSRIFFGALVLILAIAAVPVSKAIIIRSQAASSLEAPLALTSGLAQTARDLMDFAANATELRLLKTSLAKQRLTEDETRGLLLENQRLTKLLEIRTVLPADSGHALFARVISRSPTAWNRIFLIDKGTDDGVRLNRPVLAGQSLIGKIIEAGPSVSKVLLITDPASRIGVLVQRTRQQGVLHGTAAGESRIKYLSVDTKLVPGDVIESAGFGGSFPKGLLVGRVLRAWREPGQIYQVALIAPATDLSRIEEVVCLV